MQRQSRYNDHVDAVLDILNAAGMDETTTMILLMILMMVLTVILMKIVMMILWMIWMMMLMMLMMMLMMMLPGGAVHFPLRPDTPGGWNSIEFLHVF